MFIARTTTIHQKVDDGVVIKSVHVVRQAVQYVFETEEELDSFHCVFGRTMTFGKWCHRPMVGKSKYLQDLDILNVVVPLTAQDVENGKRQGIQIRFDGKDVSITIHYHKFIYRNNSRTRCPCPVLKAAIEYSSTSDAANHAANTLQIDSLFCVDDMIFEVVAVHGDYVEAAIISPSLQMGEIAWYDRHFVAEKVRDYIQLL